MTNKLFKQFYLRDLHNVLNMLVHDLQVAACLYIVLYIVFLHSKKIGGCSFRILNQLMGKLFLNWFSLNYTKLVKAANKIPDWFSGFFDTNLAFKNSFAEKPPFIFN